MRSNKRQHEYNATATRHNPSKIRHNTSMTRDNMSAIQHNTSTKQARAPKVRLYFALFATELFIFLSSLLSG